MLVMVVQMVQLPSGSEGLDWITAQGPEHLRLIPGVCPASIAAAAAGDLQALDSLRCLVTDYATYPNRPRPDPTDGSPQDASLNNWRGSWVQVEAKHRFLADLQKRAVKEGRLAAMQWIRALCPRGYSLCLKETELMEKAAAEGHLGILKFLRSGRFPDPWNESVAHRAVPHRECILWLLCQDPPCPHDSFILAQMASRYDIEALAQVRAHARQVDPNIWTSGVVTSAAWAGKLDMIQWLRSLEPPVPWDEDVCAAAAGSNNIPLLAWLRSQSPPCPWDASAMSEAAQYAELSTLRWLRAQSPPCPWDVQCVAAATMHSMLANVEWLCAQHAPLGTDCTTKAAGQGDVRIMQLLRAQKPPCPWNKSATRMAARMGNAEMLYWLCAQDPPCPLHPDCLERAIPHGNMALLEFLRSKGCGASSSSYYAAAQSGHAHTLTWLHSIGIPPPPFVPPEGEPDVNARLRYLERVQNPMLMHLADISVPLPGLMDLRVMEARRAHCAFHGILRWYQHASSDSSAGAQHAFDSRLEDTAGQDLLVRLCMLPPELIQRIAVLAELQYDGFPLHKTQDRHI